MRRYSPKDLGEIVDGKWVLIYAESYYKPNNPKETARQYTLENVFNHARITLSEMAYRRVRQGKTSISKMISHRSWENYRKEKLSYLSFGKRLKRQNMCKSAIVDFKGGGKYGEK